MIHRPIESFQRYLLDRMVLRPSRHPIAFTPQKRIMLDKGRRQIECFVQSNFDERSTRPDLLILKFPGTAGRAERSSDFPMSTLDHLRVSMWTWNPPGYGRSEGSATLGRIANAAIEFWHQVMEFYDQQPDRDSSLRRPLRICLCGNSLGCVTALNVVANVQPDSDRTGIVLRNPPPLKPVIKRVARRYPLGAWFGPVTNHLCDSMDAMNTARRCRLPAVFLQSELDSLVPVIYQNRLIRTYRGPKQVVLLEGLEHGGITTDSHQPRIKESLQWLWTMLEIESDSN
ncbi:MAG: hypothetical protein AAGG48_01735 [Planctomycetota bacterium]